MKIIRDIINLKLKNTAVAVGKFDGIHKGHRLIMEELKNSRKEGLLSVVFTFSRSPLEIINHNNQKYILTGYEKYRFYEKSGIDVVVEYPMSDELINMSDKNFVKDILMEKLGTRKIICGNDFRFGYNRQGDIAFLKAMGIEFGYEVKVFHKLQDDRRDISSSRIRNEILNGNIEKANDLLGFPYTIIGEVTHGNEIGRTIDFPTANIVPDDDKLLPPNGVYFTRINIGKKDYDCVTNIGLKPTVSNMKKTGVETNIFDFSGDLYGELLEIRFYKYHRREKKFNNLDELKKQIINDALLCRDFFKKVET